MHGHRITVKCKNLVNFYQHPGLPKPGIFSAGDGILGKWFFAVATL